MGIRLEKKRVGRSSGVDPMSRRPCLPHTTPCAHGMFWVIPLFQVYQSAERDGGILSCLSLSPLLLLSAIFEIYLLCNLCQSCCLVLESPEHLCPQLSILEAFSPAVLLSLAVLLSPLPFKLVVHLGLKMDLLVPLLFMRELICLS